MFLKKVDILKAYKILSELSDKPMEQGATQTISILRHFFALDQFYKKNNRDAIRRQNDKKDFAEYVAKSALYA